MSMLAYAPYCVWVNVHGGKEANMSRTNSLGFNYMYTWLVWCSNFSGGIYPTKGKYSWTCLPSLLHQVFLLCLHTLHVCSNQELSAQYVLLPATLGRTVAVIGYHIEPHLALCRPFSARLYTCVPYPNMILHMYMCQWTFGTLVGSLVYTGV